MLNRRMLWTVGAVAALALGVSARAEVVGELEGVPVDNSATVAGAKLQLNGAAVRKRGYFKTDVTTLYLQQKCHTLDCIYHLNGPKRIQLSVLRDLSGAIIAKYFISDFKLVTTDAEFKQLITEVGQIGDLYGRLGEVKKGDISIIDWVPGKGIRCTFNGKVMAVNGVEYMNSPLMYEVLLRMYLGARAASDYREALLGNEHVLSNTATASAH
jgi:hypothetical protein